MSAIYGRDGKLICRIGEPGWQEALSKSEFRKENRVARTILGNGLEVSTVHVGLDMNYHEDGPPLIFETMVFDTRSEHRWRDLDQRRYATEAQAMKGHEEMVEKWRNKTALDFDED